MKLKHQLKATPPPLSFPVSLAPLLAQSPPLVCLRTLSIAVFTPFFLANLALCCFPFPLFIPFLFASLASPLSSGHLILYTFLGSHPSILYLSFIYSSFLSSLSVSPPIRPSHFPPSLVSFPPLFFLTRHLIPCTILPSNPCLCLLPWWRGDLED